MPFKSHEEYLEYQRSYYRRRKGNSAARQGLKGKDVELNKNILIPKSSVQAAPQQQGVTSTLTPSVDKGLKPSIPSSPLNLVKPASNKTTQEDAGRLSGNDSPARPTPAWSDQIWENTRRHVEELKRQGWEIDGVGNAYRIVKE